MQMRTTHRISRKPTRKWTTAPLLLSGFLGTLKPQEEQTQRHLGGLTFPATHHCFSQGLSLGTSEATCDCARHCVPSEISADRPFSTHVQKLQGKDLTGFALNKKLSSGIAGCGDSSNFWVYYKAHSGSLNVWHLLQPIGWGLEKKMLKKARSCTVLDL